MIRPIIRDMFFLNRKSEPATEEDLYIAEDLKDTLAAHRDGCVGMAANMIGYLKDIIIVSVGLIDVVMFNQIQKHHSQVSGCVVQGTHAGFFRMDGTDHPT